MTQPFSPNPQLIAKAAAQLAPFSHLYWILGASATGKSTVCQYMAGQLNLPIYDMDAHIYDAYMPHYSAERHPACTAWFGAENPLAWVMALSWAEFDALNRATNAEYLDLLADHLLQHTDPQRPLLIDGGFTHPSIVAQVALTSHIVCLQATPELVEQEWNSQEQRLQMKEWVHALPQPEAMWQKFLEHDRQMSEVLVRESQQLGIPVLQRQPDTAVADLADQIITHFQLQSVGKPTTD
jgi:hypothetical protein